MDLAGPELAICSYGCGRSELGASVCLAYIDTHDDTQSQPPSNWLSRVPYFMEPLTGAGTPHLAVQPALSCGHVSGILFRGPVVSGRGKKESGDGGSDGAGGSYRFIPTSNVPRSCFHNPAS